HDDGVEDILGPLADHFLAPPTVEPLGARIPIHHAVIEIHDEDRLARLIEHLRLVANAPFGLPAVRDVGRYREPRARPPGLVANQRDPQLDRVDLPPAVGKFKFAIPLAAFQSRSTGFVYARGNVGADELFDAP